MVVQEVPNDNFCRHDMPKIVYLWPIWFELTHMENGII